MPTMTRSSRNKYMGYLFVEAFRSMEQGHITRCQLQEYLVELDNMAPRDLFVEYCTQVQANEVLTERRSHYIFSTGAHA